jgi:hypothetical protein
VINTKRRLYPQSQKDGATKNKPLVEGVDEGNKMDLLWELMKEIV